MSEWDLFSISESDGAHSSRIWMGVTDGRTVAYHYRFTKRAYIIISKVSLSLANSYSLRPKKVIVLSTNLDEYLPRFIPRIVVNKGSTLISYEQYHRGVVRYHVSRLEKAGTISLCLGDVPRKTLSRK
jgi:hypothetical protein